MAAAGQGTLQRDELQHSNIGTRTVRKSCDGTSRKSRKTRSKCVKNKISLEKR